MKQSYISSTSHPLIKEIAHLQQPSFRRQKRWFVAEGLRVVQSFLHAGYQPLYLFCQEYVRSVEIERLCDHHETIFVSEHVLHKMSSCKTPSGILAVFDQPSSDFENSTTPALVLAQISDPGNMGTLLRTAAACGLKTAIVVEGVDPWSSKVIQASAGSIAHLSVYELAWQKLVLHAKKQKITLHALVVDGSPELCTNRNQFLIVGNEAHGIPKEWQQECDIRSTIVMPGKTESLNAAVAGSIALYNSFVRQ